MADAFKFASYPSLAGRTVFVSGGATGIGEALVRAFAGQGAKVGFVDINAEAGQKLAAELAGSGASVRFAACDITDTAAYQAEIRACGETLGPIRALVNNAASDTRHDWREVTPDYWDGRMAVNFKQVFFAIQAAAPGMIAAGGGSIINFGSVSWMLMHSSLAGYASAKAGLHGLTRTMARDLGPHRIRVNTLVPGWIMTQRQLDLWVDEVAERQIAEGQCLKDKVYPDDVARMALFLAADDSKMCSAQEFIVDGGWV
ncbi:SDR family NAD(P)-dependent oxidoreductase [Radicibacter daui]|uniref:SDR family NAD(P)-dependent oxidoreductase n=1 Tax=Radicibacter daui TaxID=3064829 RepID=UPI004046AA4B